MKVVFVTGATATGKSAWALDLARETGAAIVNCDSVQVYAGPEIGANAPSAGEKSLAPHLLYSYVEAPREMTAGQYREDALAALRECRRDFALVVGGTGFYFQALERGMHDTPAVPDDIGAAVRAEVEEPGGRARLWKELHAGDPVRAARIPEADTYRLCRAVELLRIGIKPSDRVGSFTPEPFPWPLLKTTLVRDRGELREIIGRRTAAMLDRGLVEETRALLQRVSEPMARLGREPGTWAPLQAVGYKETVRFLKDGGSREALHAEICLRTGQLAKRQENWFKRDREIEVFPADGGQAAFRERCLRFFEGTGRLTP